MRRYDRSVPRRLLLSTAGALLLAGCASSGGGVAPRPSPADPGVVTRQQIESSGARTVWDALRLTVSLHVEDDIHGHPAALRHRGHASILGPQSPVLVMDGAVLGDFRHLELVPATELLSIQVRSPSYAVARYGALARAGVVELHTRRD